MGVEVVIDSDDLEKLLYATGALKVIESTVKNQKSDPFYKSAEAGFSEAHVRINTAWNNAKRGGDNRFEKPYSSEIHDIISIHEGKFSIKRMDDPRVISLRKKNLIELGNIFEVVRWANTGETHSKPLVGIPVRLTPRGQRFVEEELARRNKALPSPEIIDGEVLEYNALEDAPSPKLIGSK